jgi:hypothetical protein
MSPPASNTVATGRNNGDSLSDNFRRSMPTLGPLVALVILIIVFSLLNSNFFSLRNATNVLQQAAVLTFWRSVRRSSSRWAASTSPSARLSRW